MPILPTMQLNTLGRNSGFFMGVVDNAASGLVRCLVTGLLNPGIDIIQTMCINALIRYLALLCHFELNI